MAESVYTVVELIGTSDKSWEDAAKAAVERAAKGPAGGRGRPAGYCDRERQGRSLPH
jgi:Dodecin